MKKIAALLFVPCLMLLLSACQKDIVFVEGSGPGGDPPVIITSSMSAKVNGVFVECNFTTSQLWTDNGKQNLQLSGLKTPQGFTFNWQDFKGVGTYNAADILSSADYMAGITDPLADVYFAESGTVTIATYTNKVIIGTFAFKATNSNGETKDITEGKFTIKLEPILGPKPGTGNQSMNAKIDGSLTSFAAEGTMILNSPLGKTLTIVGTNGEKQMLISIYDFKGNGTYPIDNTIAQGGYNADLTQTGGYSTKDGVVSGKIIISSSTSTTLKGTFEFEAPNEDFRITTKKTITEGNFDVTYKTVQF